MGYICQIQPDAIIALIKLLCPQGLKFVASEQSNFGTLFKLLPHLADEYSKGIIWNVFLGVDKLDLTGANPQEYYCFYSIFLHLRELECYFDMLLWTNFPVLHLDKIYISDGSYENVDELNDISFILRHQVKHLHIRLHHEATVILELV